MAYCAKPIKLILKTLAEEENKLGWPVRLTSGEVVREGNFFSIPRPPKVEHKRKLQVLAWVVRCWIR